MHHTGSHGTRYEVDRANEKLLVGLIQVVYLILCYTYIQRIYIYYIWYESMFYSIFILQPIVYYNDDSK